MKKEISTNTIELKQTGYKVELYDFLTTGEVRKLQRTMFESKVPLTDTTGLDPEKASAIFNMQDMALEFLFVGAVPKDSEERVAIANVLEWVGSLPPVDGNLVYNKVTSLMNNSMMTEDAKKN